MNRTENVPLPEGYTQVCVWPATLVEEGQSEQFEKFILDNLNTRVKYLETIVTGPDADDPTTGGRHDVFFVVHPDDIEHFALPRLKLGIRWVEDVLSPINYRHPIYPERVFQYISWDATISFESENSEEDDE